MKKLFLGLMLLFGATISFYGQEATINQNGLQSTVTNTLSADATQAKRYEIAKVLYNSHHWQNSSVIEIELFNIRHSSGYEKFVVEVGYAQGTTGGSQPRLEHVQSRGIERDAKITLGSPVDHSIVYGGYVNKVLPIYLDVRHYGHYKAKITHLRTKVDSFTAHQQIIINESPLGVNIADFSLVPFAGITNKEGVVGINTRSPGVGTSPMDDVKLHVNGGATVSSGKRISLDHNYFVHAYMQFDSSLPKARFKHSGYYGHRFDDNGGTRMVIQQGGNVGIGIATPEAGLDLRSVERKAFRIYKKGLTDKYLSVWHGTSGAVIEPIKTNGTLSHLYLGGYDNPTNVYLSNKAGGTVGIGTTDTQGFKLGVNGRIAATEVKVAKYEHWADFVFEEDYDLPTLKEVEEHIEEKGHLENIPSAEEVKKDGFFLGEMDAKLLRKIEELMLYTIEQEKELKKQEVRAKSQQEKMEQLEKENVVLKNRLDKIEELLKKLKNN